jgi:hypothetical protein
MAVAVIPGSAARQIADGLSGSIGGGREVGGKRLPAALYDSVLVWPLASTALTTLPASLRVALVVRFIWVTAVLILERSAPWQVHSESLAGGLFIYKCRGHASG